MSSHTATRPLMSPSSLHGKDAEYERLVTQLIATPAPRLAFIGPTSGETAARLQKAVDDPIVRGHFADRRVFITCDSASSPELAIVCLASALGLEPSEDAMGAICDHFTTHDPTLIVLENLDHIYSHADPEQQEATDVMLVTLASLDDIALVVTLCGGALPDCVTWTNMGDVANGMRHYEPQPALSGQPPNISPTFRRPCISSSAESTGYQSLIADLIATPANTVTLRLESINAASIVQDLLDDPVIKAHYISCRMVVSCHGAATCKVALARLASAFGLEPEENILGTVLDFITAHGRMLVVLDHFDAIFSSARLEEQEEARLLIATLASMGVLTLVIVLHEQSQQDLTARSLDVASVEEVIDDAQSASQTGFPGGNLQHVVTTVPSASPICTGQDDLPPSIPKTSHALVHSETLVPALPVAGATDLDHTLQPDGVTRTSSNDSTTHTRRSERRTAASSDLPQHATTKAVTSLYPPCTTPSDCPPPARQPSPGIVDDNIFTPAVAATTVDSATSSYHTEHQSSQTSYRPVTIAQSRVLPARPVMFHGREKELKRLVAYAIESSTPPIGIVGPGGIGKTTLALKVLHEPSVKQHFGQERFFLSCDGANSVEEVLAQLAGKLDVQSSQNTPLWPRILDNLRSRQRVLILLDNFESIWTPTNDELRAASEVFLAQLSVLDELTLLVTTRGNLLPESFTWANADTAELDTLSSTAARQTFNDLTCLKPQLLESEPEANALTELLREVDFVPLAIVLLARLDDPPSLLLREWYEHYAAVLEADHHDGTRRELSVEVSIKISLAHLPAESINFRPRQLLSVLGLLPAGLFPVVSELLQLTIPNIDSAAQDLLRHSLAYTGGYGELRMLSPVRHYVITHLLVPEATLRVLENIYVHTACTRRPGLNWGDFDDPAYDIEVPNILSILSDALDRRSDMKLVLAVINHATYCSYHGKPCLRLLLKLRFRIEDHSEYGTINLQLIAVQHLLAGEVDSAKQYLGRAADLCAKLENKQGEAGARMGLAVASSHLGQDIDADRHKARAELLKRESSDFSLQVMPGEDDRLAERRLRDAREACLQAGDDTTRLSDQILEIVRNREDAVAYAKELKLAIALAERTCPKSMWVGMQKVHLADWLMLKCHTLDGAEDLLIEAFTVISQYNMRGALAFVTQGVSILRACQRRPREAIELVEVAAGLYREYGDLAAADMCNQETEVYREVAARLDKLNGVSTP